MICVTLLFIVTLTAVSEVTSFRCSNQQLPASGDDDLQQVATLQYCLIDNCTIMMIDTGERLDIAYTTDSLIVTTPTSDHTSQEIAKLDNEIHCYATAADGLHYHFTLSMVTNLLVALISGYVVALHLMLKKLRNLFGKVLMLYSFTVLCSQLTSFVWFMLHVKIAVNSQFACHTITVVLNVVFMCTALSATCVLILLAHFMYRSHKLQQEMSERGSKQVFIRCAIYVVGTALLVFFLTICYDVVTDSGRYTIQQDGYCVIPVDGTYKSIVLTIIIVLINKIVHVVAFIFYLYYTYKLKQDNVKQELLRKLHRTAIAMGSTIGLSAFILILDVIFTLQVPELFIGVGLVEQLAIAVILTEKKTRLLCREYFSN